MIRLLRIRIKAASGNSFGLLSMVCKIRIRDNGNGGRAGKKSMAARAAALAAMTRAACYAVSQRCLNDGVNGIEFTKTKARHPQTNGICERFHKTILNEFYRVAFRRKLYHSLEELQIDLDAWIDGYNMGGTHQGKMCCGRTPMQTLLDGKSLWIEKVGQLN